jgi:cation diffusion facilitator CzcD-associated flavoprotein CzcO
VIIGAGVGGLGMAIRLLQNGFDDFVLLERSDDLGGTWHLNRYPDVAVDVPGILYQFSFELNPHWSRIFPKGAEVKKYIDGVAAKYALRQRIHFRTEVISRLWDVDNHLWRLVLASGKEVTTRYVITAVGIFVEPKEPDIPGLDSFAGEVMKTMSWPDNYDFAGKRVAVIGTGASAIQMLPQVAKTARHVDVYQRNAIWVFPKPDLKIHPFAQQALAHVPGLYRATRALAGAVVELGLIGITVYGKQLAGLITLAGLAGRGYLFTQIRDKRLRRELTPTYRFGCKRPSVSNLYFKTFTRENVELITDGIAEVTQTGVIDRTGTHRPIDTLILATGFHVLTNPDVYRRHPVIGRDGFDLAEFYAANSVKAYEGLALPGLPNTFMIGGPYSWTGSAWHVLVENASRIVVKVLTEARDTGATAVSVTPEANDRFFEFVHPRATRSVLHAAGCAGSNTYYLDHHNELTLLRPTTAHQATRASKTFSLDDFSFETKTRTTAWTGPAIATSTS